MQVDRQQKHGPEQAFVLKTETCTCTTNERSNGGNSLMVLPRHRPDGICDMATSNSPPVSRPGYFNRRTGPVRER